MCWGVSPEPKEVSLLLATPGLIHQEVRRIQGSYLWGFTLLSPGWEDSSKSGQRSFGQPLFFQGQSTTPAAGSLEMFHFLGQMKQEAEAKVCFPSPACCFPLRSNKTPPAVQHINTPCHARYPESRTREGYLGRIHSGRRRRVEPITCRSG